MHSASYPAPDEVSAIELPALKMSRQQQQQQDTVSPAPCVSCAQCRSRVIWPVEYRGPSSTHKPGFIYVGCRSEHATVIEATTTPRKLISENGTRSP